MDKADLADEADEADLMTNKEGPPSPLIHIKFILNEKKRIEQAKM